jgi:polyribonucleotide nucleotidyltransferase
VNKLNFDINTVEFEYGNRKYKIETGKVARQATASVMVSSGDLSVLTTVVAQKDNDPLKDFFPLAVFYQEKFYAAGRIPGGFFKREGRPTENETLVSRLIDRPIRPLFPSSFTNEVQVICTVMSADKDQNPDIASMIGASAALSISGIPFQGPIGAARVGFIDDSFVINPSNEQLKGSYLDMVVAGTKDAVLMVESEAKELDEDLMLGAVLFGHQEMQKVVDACNELKSKVNPDMWEVEEVPTIKEYETQISSNFLDEIENAFKIADKSSRGEAISSVREKIKSSHEDLDELEQARLMTAFKNVEKSVVRKSILSNQPRIDGRDLDTVRPIEVETSFLQKTHGSSLFTRGETQAIVAATLGSTKDAQRIENLSGESTDAFMLHYNFPGYSVGEISFPGGPKRREIGHGNLAKRAIKAVLPDLDSFGYTLRVVSEITESNGSSSMATVCGTSLSLMDAGVPITNAVAGVAMGLIKEGDDFAVLTDILGDEDHLGDMDFKVAGTADGVTALQMDIKIEGINEQIMDAALEKAKAARMHILDVMNAVIDKPKEVSDNAPAMKKFTVHQDKIKEIIGKGGAVIKNIQQESGASVDINDDGVVTVFGENQSVMQAALSMIETIIEDPEVNKIYDGKVVKIVDFGAFVNILPGKDGLLHISEISEERTENVSDVLSEGDTIKVKLIGFDRGKLKLSAKAVDKE